MYLLESTWRGREECGERHANIFHHWFTLQIVTTATPRPIPNQEPEISSWFSMQAAGAHFLIPFQVALAGGRVRRTVSGSWIPVPGWEVGITSRDLTKGTCDAHPWSLH